MDRFTQRFLGNMDAALKRARPRGASLSGRLRSASDLCDDGTINPQEKGVLKDLIIFGNPALDAAFAAYERGDVAPLKGVCSVVPVAFWRSFWLVY